MNTIEITNISKRYGSVEALRDITLNVAHGELFGLIGPDGAGKTSLFRILTTLLLADGGSATVSGEDVVKDFRSIRNHIGYMPGRFSLYQDLSIEENLRFFADVFGTTIRENYDMIRDIYVQIEPFKKRRAGKLSGGMKQKLALCCALIHKPKVLFLDEPTTGVDPVSRKEFWEMLRKLKEQGITILVSTPYMDEAAMCDRIAFINQGKILTVNTPEKIVAGFPYRLYAVESGADGSEMFDTYKALLQLRTVPAVRSAYISGDTIHITLTDDNCRLAVMNYQYNEISPTVEDCFIELLC
jgi:ABC-type multidrug transport system ATPase subunit